MTVSAARLPASTLEDVTSDDITKAYVVRRVRDWETRIDDLYARVGSWLATGHDCHALEHVSMREDLMKRTGVAARSLPVLTISTAGHVVGRIEPRGLWIVGANGHLDMLSPSGRHVLFDGAENFKTPEWRISALSARQKPENLTRPRLVALFG